MVTNETLRRAVFLDRDGVLNRSNVRGGRPYAPTVISDFTILPEAPEAVSRLRAAGFLAIVVTNQKDVGRGIVSQNVMAAMHDELRTRIPVDGIEVCTCIDDCPCYKPNPGMLFDAAAEWKIDLSVSYMVGDRWRDVGAGVNAGCFTIFLDRGYEEPLRDKPDRTVADVSEAADLILTEDPARIKEA
jgi:D-glycero-D-manno-heptose 1,7-bisphosphate phosphatase